MKFEIEWTSRATFAAKSVDSAKARVERIEFDYLRKKSNGLDFTEVVRIESLRRMDRDTGVNLIEQRPSMQTQEEVETTAALMKDQGFNFDVELPALPKLVYTAAEKGLTKTQRALLMTFEAILVDKAGVFSSTIVTRCPDVATAFTHLVGSGLLVSGTIAKEDQAALGGADRWVRLSAEGFQQAWACRQARSESLIRNNPIPSTKIPGKRTPRKKSTSRKAPAKKVTRKAPAKKAAKKAVTKKAAKKRARK